MPDAPQIVYLNGQFVALADAKVSVLDRGFIYGDGVYEVVPVYGRRAFRMPQHLSRLQYSLGGIRLANPHSNAEWEALIGELVARQPFADQAVYLQITRGVAPRDHGFPKSAKPTLVVTSRTSRRPDPRLWQDGIAVITIPDIRWKRCDIKSISLISNVLGKQQAREAGVFEAWQIDSEGRITEGTSTNAWIVTGDAMVVTRTADNAILNGVTRLAVLDIIAREGYRLDERPFTVEEAKAAREAFLTSTTSDVLPVVHIDGTPIGNGKPGSLSLTLRAAYLAHAAVSA